MGMEAFQDSAVVNGTAFPSLTVDPRAYRFRILNAASDRFWNLSFYEADPAQVSSRPHGPASPPDRSQDGAGIGRSCRSTTTGRPSGRWTAVTAAYPIPALYRAATAPTGPSFLQIGTEGGFLPKPVVIEPQPITYITDPTAFWVGNVDKMGLALGPAERADVIVDFSAYAGKTLILYNDAPAAWPARVPAMITTPAPRICVIPAATAPAAHLIRSPASGMAARDPWSAMPPTPAPSCRSSYVRSAAPWIVRYTFNRATLETEFTAAAPVTAIEPGTATKTLFERAQEPIIVGQAAYSSAYPNSYFPTNYPWEGINQINDHFLKFVTLAGEPVNVPTEPKGHPR